jgi:hypothetical protein
VPDFVTLDCLIAGMSLPTPCPMDGSLSFTCFYEGLTQPALCPNGTLCGTPFLPPLPAPPGFAQSVGLFRADRGFSDSAYSSRTLVPCSVGQWCGLGRAVSEGVSLLACPAGSFCSEPALLEPTICNLGGNCTVQSCPQIPYCPAGSTSESLCPAGYFCPNTTTDQACSAGSYCPAGSPLWQLCPSSKYCPNASEALECPDNA